MKLGLGCGIIRGILSSVLCQPQGSGLLEAHCCQSNSCSCLLPMWPWANDSTSPMKRENDGAGGLEWLWETGGIIYAQHLAQCSAQSEHSVGSSCCIYTRHLAPVRALKDLLQFLIPSVVIIGREHSNPGQLSWKSLLLRHPSGG